MTEREQPMTVARAVAAMRDRLERVLGTQAHATAAGVRTADAAMLRRVRLRLVAWSAGLTLLLLLLLGPILYGAVARSLAMSGRQQLDVRASMIISSIQREPVFVGRRLGNRRPPIGFSVGGPAAGTFAYIVGPGGTSLAPEGAPTGALPDQASLAAARASGRDVRDVSVSGIPLRVLSTTVEAGQSTFLLQVVQDRTSEQRALGALLAVLVGGGLVAAGGAALLGAIYADRALVPIRESLRRQRQFAADASHELRTPLAVIRSSIEYLERHRNEPIASANDTLKDMRDEVDHLSVLVGDLLLLARTDSGVVQLERVPLDLSDVTAEGLASVSAVAEARGVQLRLDPEPAPVTGDPVRLRQLVTILVDNAIAHTPESGTVTARLRTAKDGVRLSVEDDGPGLAPEDIPRVFDRFWRGADAPEGGTGLGLAIAAWIVEQHGGRISASNRATGGASFTVTLPPRR